MISIGPRTAAAGPLRVAGWLAPGPYGYQHLDFFSQRGPESVVVAQLRGVGGQGTGDVPVHACRATLARLLSEPAYGALDARPRARPAAEVAFDVPEWVAWWADTSPLPAAGAALVQALADRIDHVIRDMRASGLSSVSASGVIAIIEGPRVAITRRGLPRVHVACTERARLVVDSDHVASAPVSIREIARSAFGLGAASDRPVELELAAGERLVIVSEEASHMIDQDPALVAEPGCASLRRGLALRRPRSGWAITEVAYTPSV